MNTILYRKELKRDFKVFMIITLALTGFLSITLLMYSEMKESMSDIAELYSSMGEGIMEALNFQDGQWNHILGFYATYFVYYIPMMTGSFAIYLGASLLSREEHQKTAEFLLAKPISRGEIVKSKLAVLFTYVTLTNMVLWVNGFLWSAAVSGFAETFTQITIMHIYGWFICLFFGALGFMITVFMKRAKAIIGPGIGLVMGLYMFDMIIRISDKADFLLYFTPYKYMNIDLLSSDYHMEWWRLLITGGATAIMITLSYVFYRKKDILL